MKVLIDTNVLVSSVIRGRRPKQALDLIIGSQKYEWVVSNDILAEYIEVIQRRKFKLTSASIQFWLNLFSSLEIIEDKEIEFSFPRDPKDEKFFKCALAANADYFITGDGDFKGIIEIGNTIVIKVSEFLRIEMENG